MFPALKGRDTKAQRAAQRNPGGIVGVAFAEQEGMGSTQRTCKRMVCPIGVPIRGGRGWNEVKPREVIRGGRGWNEVKPREVIRGGRGWNEVKPREVIRGGRGWNEVKPREVIRLQAQRLPGPMIQLTDQPIDPQAVLDRVASPAAGAVVLFLGTVRHESRGRATVALEYESYADMARKELEQLAAEARKRWALCECAIVHRLGRMEVGQLSVAIAVSSPHRREAFEAGQWLIDRIKQVVPIWKNEQFADGTCEWVHPGTQPGA